MLQSMGSQRVRHDLVTKKNIRVPEPVNDSSGNPSLLC